MGIIIVIIWIIANCVITEKMTDVLLSKGYEHSVNIWVMIFLLGIAGWIYVLALPDLVQRNTQMKILINQEKILKKIANTDNSRSSMPTEELPEL